MELLDVVAGLEDPVRPSSANSATPSRMSAAAQAGEARETLKLGICSERTSIVQAVDVFKLNKLSTSVNMAAVLVTSASEFASRCGRAVLPREYPWFRDDTLWLRLRCAKKAVPSPW